MKNFIFLILTFVIAIPAFADDTVLIVFDTSGSMQQRMQGISQTRLEVAKKALIQVLSDTPITTKVGVLSFQGWTYKIAPITRNTFADSINNCQANGGTPLYEFIKFAGTTLLIEREKNANIGSYKLIVVTDGEASDNNLNANSRFSDGTIKLGVIQDIISRGIVIDTIALEMSSNHSLKTSINGSYMKGDDLKTLTQSLSKSLAEVNLNGKDGISEGIFKEIDSYPIEFLTSVIQGITEVRNHPIGELPALKKNDVKNSVSSLPENPPHNQSAGSMIIMIFFILFCVAMVFVVASIAS